MTPFEMLEAHADLLRRLDAMGVKVSDHALVGMVGEYISMKDKHKTSYVVAYLSAKHGKSERTVYRAVRRLCRGGGR